MVVEQGNYRGTGIPIKLSRTPGEIRRPPARLGADGPAILRELGYAESDIRALQQQGVLVMHDDSATQD
jgi:crotonobetainyl-CoA:carnitine CoA-transferase CaiB-like acyl-CoA transferase